MTDPDTAAGGEVLGRIAPAKPVLLMDFDGTICLGDGPIWAYADAVIAEIHGAAASPGGAGRGSAASGAVEATIRDRLRAYLAGDIPVGATVHVDGYAAVAALAADHLTREQLQSAYQASRRALQNDGITVHAPEGLDTFLRDWAGHVERVVVTNAPDEGVHSTLEELGLADVIDGVVTNARKPGGWQHLLPPLLDGREPVSVMTIGDIWVNDLQLPWQAGCCTALIDRFGRHPGPVHLVARRFEDLYDSLRQWASDPVAFAASHLQL